MTAPEPSRISGSVPAREPTVPLVAAGICADLSLVATAPIHTDLAIRLGDDYRAVPPTRPGRPCVDAQRNMESRCW